MYVGCIQKLKIMTNILFDSCNCVILYTENHGIQQLDVIYLENRNNDYELFQFRNDQSETHMLSRGKWSERMPKDIIGWMVSW